MLQNLAIISINCKCTNVLLTVQMCKCTINHRDLRIGNFCSNHESNRQLRFKFESNQGVVVYVFNADCHRSCVLPNIIIIKLSNNYYYRRTEMCGFSCFLKQYYTIAPTVLASVYALAT